MADTIDYQKAEDEAEAPSSTAGNLSGEVALLAALVAGQTADGTAVRVPVELYGPDTNDAVAAFLRERVTGAFPTITTDHAFIHEGIAYKAAGFLTVANGQTGTIRVSAPASGYVHFKPAAIQSTASVQVTLYEGATVTGSETARTPRNQNRRRNDAATVTVNSCPNATLGSTTVEIDAALVPGGGTGATRVGGQVNAAEEVVLDASTDYIIAIANASGGAATIGWSLFWYEEASA